MPASEDLVTDKRLRSWLNAGPIDRGIGGGLTFVATEASAMRGTASWILRYRFGGRHREKVLGRYPDVSLKEARELARKDRSSLQQGVDVSAVKRAQKLKAMESQNVSALASLWYERYIAAKYKNPEPVESALRLHVKPVIGRLPVEEVRPIHIDQVLRKIVDAGSLSVANDVVRYLRRMFHFAVKRRWIEFNPAYGFDSSDAGGPECARERWLRRDELVALGKAMRESRTFGRENELSVWLLLALCVRKMELLSARWSEFDFENRVWRLHRSRTKTTVAIDIPLAEPVVAWLNEVKVFACGSDFLFPARKPRAQVDPKKASHPHVHPDTLNVALNRLRLNGMEHFTVHDMRRTGRTHMAALGINRFVAERALNHKIRDVEGVYDQYDYFEERREALARWALLLSCISEGRYSHAVEAGGALGGEGVSTECESVSSVVVAAGGARLRSSTMPPAVPPIRMARALPR